jgi:hypothetical protein
VNLFSKLPFLKSDDAEQAEVDETQARKDRIKFHRDHVRNGPSNFKTLTSGQIRRAQRRELNGRTKKARRAQVQNYFATQRLAATVRAHLQHAGVLPFVNENHVLDLHKQVVSAAWIVQRFGTEIEVEVTDDDGETRVVKTGEMSFQKHDVLTALDAACKFVGQASGKALSVPADYEVPVYAEPVSA